MDHTRDTNDVASLRLSVLEEMNSGDTGSVDQAALLDRYTDAVKIFALSPENAQRPNSESAPQPPTDRYTHPGFQDTHQAYRLPPMKPSPVMDLPLTYQLAPKFPSWLYTFMGADAPPIPAPVELKVIVREQADGSAEITIGRQVIVVPEDDWDVAGSGPALVITLSPETLTLHRKKKVSDADGE